MQNRIMLRVSGDTEEIISKFSDCAACADRTESAGDFTFSYNKGRVHRDECVSALADYIIEKYERPIINKIIRESCGKMSSVQKKFVLDGIARYNTDELIGYEARKRLICDRLCDYLAENRPGLFLDGFVSFRLKEYEGLLEEMVEVLSEDYLTEREYDEFIGLLRYFVSIQKQRPALAGVLVRTDGVYEIFNSGGENITRKCLADFVSEDAAARNVNFDDLLISMLITLAPEKIIIHNGDKIKNNELFETIKRVFDGNVTYCPGCGLCRKVKK